MSRGKYLSRFSLKIYWLFLGHTCIQLIESHLDKSHANNASSQHLIPWKNKIGFTDIYYSFF